MGGRPRDVVGEGPHLARGLVVRTKGTVWDTPGPAAPAVIGRLVLPTTATRDKLAEASRAHGVPHTPDLLTLIADGKRTPRLPSDAERGG